ncbi:MAG: putative oxidoreductase CzcO [Anaerolineae bacterium]|nr:putative oxidoreductase CzcO [Anaerolineae bacterium]
MAKQIETVIIGGGQAGLALSYYLTQQQHEHIVLEQAAEIGHAWRNGRWDSFTLVTPNWAFRLPGAEYQGDAPHGFMPRSEIISHFEHYVAQFRLPVRYRVRVTAVSPKPNGRGYLVSADDATFEAANVVIATGLFQRPRLPVFCPNLPPEIMQLHSGQYRSPQSLPPGAVLVVGSAQSGCQIAEELYLSGRQVYLCVCSAGRAPRRYRGKDIYEWLNLSGFLARTADKLPSLQARFAGNPHVSGKGGGRTLNLHQFARDGVVLLGRIAGAQNGKIMLAPDLMENLAKVDKFESDVLKMIDTYIELNGLAVPEEHVPQLRDGYQANVVRELDCKSAGISTVIWAMGYAFDFSLVRLPIFDNDGYPMQQRGVTGYPGLYFLGLPWLHTQKSGLLLGVGEDAAYLVSKIVNQRK